MSSFSTSEIEAGCRTLVTNCADLQPGEKALIITDETTAGIGEVVAAVAHEITHDVTHITIPPLTIHGEEPSSEATLAMSESNVIFGMTKMSLAHTQARHNATKYGAKYLSLPEYSREVLCRLAMQFDFRALTSVCDRIVKLLNKGESLIIHSGKREELNCDIRTRKANPAPGWCFKPGSMASPPDAEVNIAPLEYAPNGAYAVNGSITSPSLGLLDASQKLIIQDGAVVKLEGSKAQIINQLFDHAESSKSRIAGEIGFGLNPAADLSGAMLEDEGCLGCLHIGFGSNATIGGDNTVSFHVDFVTRKSTVILDDQIILDRGRYAGEIGRQLSDIIEDAKT